MSGAISQLPHMPSRCAHGRLHLYLSLQHKLPVHKRTYCTDTYCYCMQQQSLCRQVSKPSPSHWYLLMVVKVTRLSAMSVDEGPLLLQQNKWIRLAMKPSGETKLAKFSVAYLINKQLYKHVHTRHGANPHTCIMLHWTLTLKDQSLSAGHRFHNFSEFDTWPMCHSGN